MNFIYDKAELENAQLNINNTLSNLKNKTLTFNEKLNNVFEQFAHEDGVNEDELSEKFIKMTNDVGDNILTNDKVDMKQFYTSSLFEKIKNDLIEMSDDEINEDNSESEVLIMKNVLSIELINEILIKDENDIIKDEKYKELMDEYNAIQYAKSKPCKTKQCIAAKRMFGSTPTFALALLIAAEAANISNGNTPNSTWSQNLHCEWCRRWSNSCC